jgi:hypothetical protein
MTEGQMTKEQEVLLDEAAKYAQLFEQQAQALDNQCNTLTIKVERLSARIAMNSSQKSDF